ncbi:MAG: dethiobiotin synthase [Verrucomicrobia bacterium]|nr:dethiobiotin synthase [Verrucomicrobiota bacterium]
MNFFISGTDTGVGKTHVARILLETLRANGIDAVGYKPIVCGDRDDARILSLASGDVPIEQVNPVWLKTPAAPWVAAQLENRVIDFASLIEGYETLAAQHETVIVEGIGGWEVPITADYSTADFARALHLPVVLVVANRLGAINHTVLSCQSIRSRGLSLRGIILNHLVDELDTVAIANKQVIPAVAKAPLLCEVIHGQDWIDCDWFDAGANPL